MVGELAAREDGAIGITGEIKQGAGVGQSSHPWAVRGGVLPGTIMVVAEEDGTTMAKGMLRCSEVQPAMAKRG